MYDEQRLAQLAEQICAVGAFLFSRGWSPATSSNYSARLDERHAAVTVSGRPKGELSRDDVMVVDLAGRAVTPDKRPSAETLLHTLMYRTNPALGAVLHTHSVNATVLSKLYAARGALRLDDYELLKGLEGVATHELQKTVPIFPNTQDIPALAVQVTQYLAEHPETHGYLIAGHGLYTWGADLAEARRHVEAFEFLFECEVLALRLGAPTTGPFDSPR